MTLSFAELFEQMPQLLRQSAEQHWLTLLDNAADVAQSLSPALQFRAKCCFALSDFVAESSIYTPIVFERVLLPQQTGVNTQIDYPALIGDLDQLDSEPAFISQIRQLRKSLKVNIAVADLLKQQSIEQSYQLVSNLSDLLILSAYRMAYKQVSKVFGTPLSRWFTYAYDDHGYGEAWWSRVKLFVRHRSDLVLCSLWANPRWG